MRRLKGCLSSGVTSYDTGWRKVPESEACSRVLRKLLTHRPNRALKGRWWGGGGWGGGGDSGVG